jgi:hypothetical protein
MAPFAKTQLCAIVEFVQLVLVIVPTERTIPANCRALRKANHLSVDSHYRFLFGANGTVASTYFRQPVTLDTGADLSFRHADDIATTTT